MNDGKNRDDQQRMVEDIAAGLVCCVADDYNEVNGYLNEALQEYEAMQLVDREVLEDAVEELRDKLSDVAMETARKLVREIAAKQGGDTK